MELLARAKRAEGGEAGMVDEQREQNELKEHLRETLILLEGMLKKLPIPGLQERCGTSAAAR